MENASKAVIGSTKQVYNAVADDIWNDWTDPKGSAILDVQNESFEFLEAVAIDLEVAADPDKLPLGVMTEIHFDSTAHGS